MNDDVNLDNKIYWRDRVGHCEALLDDAGTYEPRRVGGIHRCDGKWWTVIGNGSVELGPFRTKTEAKTALVQRLQ